MLTHLIQPNCLFEPSQSKTSDPPPPPTTSPHHPTVKAWLVYQGYAILNWYTERFLFSPPLQPEGRDLVAPLNATITDVLRTIVSLPSFLILNPLFTGLHDFSQRLHPLIILFAPTETVLKRCNEGKATVRDSWFTLAIIDLHETWTLSIHMLLLNKV